MVCRVTPPTLLRRGNSPKLFRECAPRAGDERVVAAVAASAATSARVAGFAKPTPLNGVRDRPAGKEEKEAEAGVTRRDEGCRGKVIDFESGVLVCSHTHSVWLSLS